MREKRFALTAAAFVLIALTIGMAGCGSSGSKAGSGGGSSAALAADAKSAATGDIPDNQNFLTFKDRQAGFSIRYPEGWSQTRSGGAVRFQDKNNLVRVEVGTGPAPTVASVTAAVGKLKASSPTLKAQPATKLTLKGKQLVKVSYTTQSAPNPVTGKRVTLIVDRYELAQKGKVAVVELGTAQGVDNVDAYRMMIESFTWL
jgi:hypothetical protein